MAENKEKQLSSLDAEEIARVFCGITNEDAEIDEIEKALYDKHDMSFEQFEKVAAFMFAHLELGVSPLTNTPMIGISHSPKKGMSCWLAKRDYTGEYIGTVIQWLTEGEPIAPDSKGFSRTITAGGKPEFEITIQKPSKAVKTKTKK